ncbi:hypothetical protein OY671_013102, partial [Metschnikowia pulcherrima]
AELQRDVAAQHRASVFGRTQIAVELSECSIEIGQEFDSRIALQVGPSHGRRQADFKFHRRRPDDDSKMRERGGAQTESTGRQRADHQNDADAAHGDAAESFHALCCVGHRSTRSDLKNGTSEYWSSLSVKRFTVRPEMIVGAG